MTGVIVVVNVVAVSAVASARAPNAVTGQNAARARIVLPANVTVVQSAKTAIVRRVMPTQGKPVATLQPVIARATTRLPMTLATVAATTASDASVVSVGAVTASRVVIVRRATTTVPAMRHQSSNSPRQQMLKHRKALHATLVLMARRPNETMTTVAIVAAVAAAVAVAVDADAKIAMAPA